MKPYQRVLTGKEFENEREACRFLDGLLIDSECFQIYREVTGHYVQHRLASKVKDARIDRVLSPTLILLNAGWSPRALFTTVNRQGVLFLWPIRLPGEDGRVDEWSRSALECAARARDHWCRVQANMSLGGYELCVAENDALEPHWPEHSLAELLRVAFKDRFIDDLDHAVLRKLRGEI